MLQGNNVHLTSKLLSISDAAANREAEPTQAYARTLSGHVVLTKFRTSLASS